MGVWGYGTESRLQLILSFVTVQCRRLRRNGPLGTVLSESDVCHLTVVDTSTFIVGVRLVRLERLVRLLRLVGTLYLDFGSLKHHSQAKPPPP